jgi:cytochrome b pre-mRNA-processing protein 3
MLWPFNQFSKPRGPLHGTIEAIYGMIVTQAREPVFYRELGVADTVNGRFDLLLLHLWMVLRRFRSANGAAEASQALFDHFCADMDANLREMGVGDLAVPKRMQAFGEAFYGRGAAYDAAFADDDALTLAFCRNVLNGKGMENARRLAIYAKRVLAYLDGVHDAALLAAAWTFPALTEAGESHSRRVMADEDS